MAIIRVNKHIIRPSSQVKKEGYALDLIGEALSGTTGGALLGSGFGLAGGIIGSIIGGFVTGYAAYSDRKARQRNKTTI